MADAVLLDTSAILTLTGNEPGADEVQTYLAEAIAERIHLHGSFASLTEVEYITVQEEGAEAAPSGWPTSTGQANGRKSIHPSQDETKT